ncbi:hypothetical protein ACHAXT_012398 [Thalassiosira profunda]
MPSTPLTFLYAALAENPACGPSSYEDAVRCGNPMKSGGGVDEMAASEDIEVVVSKEASKDGIEVGMASDGSVFGRAKVPSPSTPGTVPITPDSSLGTQSKDSKEEAGPLMPSVPELNPIEDIGKLQRRPLSLVKNGSFQSTATTTVCSNSSKRSSASRKSRCTTPDDIERAREVEISEEDGSFPEANATLSKSSSTLSQLAGRERETASPTSADVSSLSDPEYKGGVISIGDDRPVATPSKLDFSFAPVTRPSFDVLCHEHALRQGATEFKLQPKSEIQPPPKSSSFAATSNMFTKDDVDAITPLQVTAYLTSDERKKISTKVLSAKLKKGYTLADATNICESCNMPQLSASGKLVEGCVICPVLKKQVLKKILAAATPDVDIDASSFATTQSADVRTADLSLGDKSLPLADGSKEANGKGTAGGDNVVKERGFNARQSLLNAFKTQLHYEGLRSSLSCNINLPLESDDDNDAGRSADPILQARDMIWNGAAQVSEALKESVPKCHDHIEEGKKAVAVSGELMMQRASMVPEALRYKHQGVTADVGCRALAFDEVKGNVAHVAEVLAGRTGCSARFCVESDAAGDIIDNDPIAEQRREPAPVKFGQSNGDKVIVEDASDDAEETGIPWNRTVESLDLHLLGDMVEKGEIPPTTINKPFDEESGEQDERVEGHLDPAEVVSACKQLVLPAALSLDSPKSQEEDQN